MRWIELRSLSTTRGVNALLTNARNRVIRRVELQQVPGEHRWKDEWEAKDEWKARCEVF